MNTEKDTWKLGDHEFTSRFILGSGKYSLDLIQDGCGKRRSADRDHGSSESK